MNRQQKEQVVETLRSDFSQNHTSFLVSYKGLTVAQMQDLRKILREQGGTLKVAKARLVKRAIDGLDGADDFALYCKDQVALVFAEKEPTAVAKILSNFSKNNEALSIVAGYSESRVMDRELVIFMASLPPIEVVQAQLCGTLKAPVNNLAYALNGVIMKLLVVLQNVAKQKEEAQQ